MDSRSTNSSVDAVAAMDQPGSTCSDKVQSNAEELRARILELESELRYVRQQSSSVEGRRSEAEVRAAGSSDGLTEQDAEPLDSIQLAHGFARERTYDPNATTQLRDHLEKSGQDFITQLVDAECREYTCRAEVIVPSADAAQEFVSKSIPLPWDGFYSVGENASPDPSDPMTPRSVIIYATHAPAVFGNPTESGSGVPF